MASPSDTGNALRDMVAEELAKRTPLEQRIIANRVKEAIESLIVTPSEPAPTTPRPMTDQEAKEYEATPMTFGFWEGAPIAKVPLDYLEWLADRSRTLWRQLHAYLNNPRVKRKRERETE